MTLLWLSTIFLTTLPGAATNGYNNECRRRLQDFQFLLHILEILVRFEPIIEGQKCYTRRLSSLRAFLTRRRRNVFLEIVHAVGDFMSKQSTRNWGKKQNSISNLDYRTMKGIVDEHKNRKEAKDKSDLGQWGTLSQSTPGPVSHDSRGEQQWVSEEMSWIEWRLSYFMRLWGPSAKPFLDKRNWFSLLLVVMT